MLDFIDVAQNTDEWLELRGGLLTSSKLGVVMASSKDYAAFSVGKNDFHIVDNATKKILKDNYFTKADAERKILQLKKKDLTKFFTPTARKYAVNIAIEQITGKAISGDYSNGHMQRGHEQEPIARMLYEDEMFCDVSEGGFFKSDTVGCSPDGLISDCGVIEIKSVIASTQFANVKRQSLDPAYKWQCVGNLKFTGRDWLDFVSYCEEFPEDRQLFIHRIKKEDCQKEFEMIDTRISEFLKLVEESKTIILNNEYSV